MSEPQLIGLIGYAGSGKDTVAGALSTYGFKRVAFADPMREILLDTDPLIQCGARQRRLVPLIEELGWDAAKRQFPDVRRLLQDFGISVRRRIGEWTWLDIAIHRIESHLAHGEHVVVTDVRMDNEAHAIERRLGGQLWRIERPGTGPVNGHVSESELSEYEADRIVQNWGTIDDLHREVQDLVEELFGYGYTPA